MAATYRRSSRRIIYVGLETTKGTETGDYAAMEFEEGTAPTAIESDRIERNPLRASYTPSGYKTVGNRFTASGTYNFKPGGTSGGNPVAPEASALLQACGLKKTDGLLMPISGVTGTFQVGEIVEKTSGGADIGTVYAVEADKIWVHTKTLTPVATDGITGVTSTATATIATPTATFVYLPVSDPANQKTVSWKDNTDGLQKIATYVMGSMKATIGNKDMIKMEFSNLMGVYSAPTDTSLGTASFSSIEPPVCNPVSLILGSYTVADLCVQSVEFDLANTVSMVECLQADDAMAAVEITNRAPAGNLNMSATTIATFDPYTLAKAATKLKLAVTVNAAGSAGQRVRFDCPAIQLGNPSESDNNGIVTYGLPFTMTSTVEDGEFFLTQY